MILCAHCCSSRDNAVGLEQRSDLFDKVFHPIRSFREHREVKAAKHAAELREQAYIEHQHAMGLRERDFDDFDFELVHHLTLAMLTDYVF